MKFKTLSVLLFAAAIAMAAGCKQKSTRQELEFEDFLYDNIHVFAHTYADDVFVQIHLYSIDEWGVRSMGGPREMEVIRGNDKEHYYLRLKKTSWREEGYDKYEDVVYNLYLEEYADESEGTVLLSCIPYENKVERVELKLRKAAPVELENAFTLDNTELVESYTSFSDAPNTNVRLFECLRGGRQPDGDWAQSDKLLMLFLFENENPMKVDFSPMESWTIVDSPDGAIRSFWSSYYAGGNGFGSIWEMNILYYRSGDVNHVVREFDKWVCDEDGVLHGNFPYREDQKIWTWGTGENTVYFFENHYVDAIPIQFLDSQKYYRNEMALLGAFRIVNGSLIPAKVLKTKNDVLNKVAVYSDGPAANYKLDRRKGLLGVPLIEKDDYSFHGKYLIYEWNPRSGMFEYNGRKEKM